MFDYIERFCSTVRKHAKRDFPRPVRFEQGLLGQANRPGKLGAAQSSDLWRKWMECRISLNPGRFLALLVCFTGYSGLVDSSDKLDYVRTRMGYLRTFVFIFELLLGSLALGALFISPLAIALKVSLSALFFLFAGMLEFQSYDRDLKFEAMANSLEVALCALESQQLKES